MQRTIRRRRGVPTIAVRLRGRPWPAVVSDMIEGIVVGNGLSGARADRIRAALWLAIDNSTERVVEPAADVDGQRKQLVAI